MKPSGIGGMAVMEGVMMKNKEEYAVAVRKPNNEIVLEKSVHKDFADKVKLFKLPVFRGILAFIDSMVVGIKVLNYSASFFEEEEEEAQNKKKKDKSGKKNDKKSANDTKPLKKVSTADHDNTESKAIKDSTAKESLNDNDKSNALLMVFAVLISIVISVALFMVLPVLLTNFLSKVVTSRIVMNLIEGLVRLAIFIIYVLLAAKMPEIKRVFMYHGAEHKTINCLEHGCELTVANVRKHSKQHKRCGTSFMLLVILISLIVFLFVPNGNLLWRILSRVLLVPFIAGVSYEFIRLAGKTENKVVEILSKPGLWMQGLTTKEPDDTMIEVAIASVDAVFDWRTFLETSQETKKSKPEEMKKQSNSSKQGNTSKQESTSKQGNNVKQENNSKLANVSKQEDAVKPSNASKRSEASNQADKSKSDNLTTGNTLNKSNGVTAMNKPFRAVKEEVEEEDDEILKALDKFFDKETKDTKRAAEGK